MHPEYRNPMCPIFQDIKMLTECFMAVILGSLKATTFIVIEMFQPLQFVGVSMIIFIYLRFMVALSIINVLNNSL